MLNAQQILGSLLVAAVFLGQTNTCLAQSTNCSKAASQANLNTGKQQVTTLLAESQVVTSISTAVTTSDMQTQALPAPSDVSTLGGAMKSDAKDKSTGDPLPVPEPSMKDSGIPHIIFRRGQELSVGTDTEDLVPTDDVQVARKQVAAYPDSPEASFILAVALTRTSRVEEALKEVRRARKLAEAKGGPVYFDKTISTYEQMLKDFPNENRVRYGLAWAYYMKAYLLSHQSRHVERASLQASAPAKNNIWDIAALAASAEPEKKPHIEGALAKASPAIRPEIKKYYELAMQKLDELLAQQPNDIWAQVYCAFLKAEYTGDLNQAMQTWHKCQAEFPDNPAPYFFLGEGYLRQGNLKECISNVSKAIALRAIGK